MLESFSTQLAREIKKQFHKTAQPQGNANSGWIVLDYGDVVVHLFSEEQRNFYRLEDLWAEGNVILRML